MSLPPRSVRRYQTRRAPLVEPLERREVPTFATSIAIAADAAGITYGQSETYRATVATSPPGNGLPTGNVSFFEGLTKLGTAPLVNGVASITVPHLNAGSHQVGAFYEGSGTLFDASTTGSLLTTVAGGLGGDNPVMTIVGGAVDPSGNLYVVDSRSAVVRKVDLATGLSRVVAGTGYEGRNPDGVDASLLNLAAPSSITFNSAGDLFVSDIDAYKIYRIDHATHAVVTYAGNGGNPIGRGDGGPATAASIGTPIAMATSRSGDLYFSDAQSSSIRVIDHATGLIRTIAGNQPRSSDGDGGPASSAAIGYVYGLLVDSSDNVYFSDGTAGTIRKIDHASGIISRYAGGGVNFGDGGPATGVNMQPRGLAFDGSENLYLADASTRRIRRIDRATGLISSAAGSGLTPLRGPEQGNAGSTALGESLGLFGFDRSGGLLMNEWYNLPWHAYVQRFNPGSHTIETIAGREAFPDPAEGKPASTFQIAVTPPNVDTAVDSVGNLYFTDADSVRKVDAATGLLHTIAGRPGFASSGDGGPATSAVFVTPDSLAVDSADNVYVFERGTGFIHKIDHLTGIMTRFAGNGGVGQTGDGGLAINASLNADHMEFDRLDNLYIASNDRIRRIDHATGVITAVAGNGQSVHPILGGLATLGGINPMCITISPEGDVLVNDGMSIDKIDHVTGIIMRLIDLPYGPMGLAFDSKGILYAQIPNYAGGIFQNELYRVDLATKRVTLFTKPGTPPAGDGGVNTNAVVDLKQPRIDRVHDVVYYREGRRIKSFPLGADFGATVAVAKAPLTVTADSKTSILGKTPPAPGVTYAGWVFGEGPSVLIKPAAVHSSATSASPAGVYPITVDAAVADNYAITFVNGTMTVVNPYVDITGVTIRTARVGKKTSQSLVIAFTGGLSADSIKTTTGAFSLVTVAVGKKKSVAVPIAKAVYDPATRTISLSLKSLLIPHSPALILTIDGSKLLDAAGKFHVDGSGVGLEGSPYRVSIDKSGIKHVP